MALDYLPPPPPQGTMGGGHYVSYVRAHNPDTRRRGSSWAHCSDTRVNSVRGEGGGEGGGGPLSVSHR